MRSLIFFDIETVPVNIDIKSDAIEKYGEKINFMPEFNKIIVISY